MNKQKVLEHIAKDPKYIKYCQRVTANDESYKDLFQFVFIELEKKSEIFLIQKYNEGKLGKYFAAMVYNNYNSTTSPFYKEYNKYYKYHVVKKETYEVYNYNSDGLQAPDFVYESHLQTVFVSEDEFIGIEPDSLKQEIEIFRQESAENEYIVSLFKVYMECRTFREVERRTGIYFVTAQKTIQKFRKEIKKRCQKYLL